MDCPSCGHPNAATARFCGDCATPLSDSVRCPSCGSPNPGDQRFCNACAEALAGAQPPDRRTHTPEHLAQKIRAQSGALEGERKLVTVLFADVMGSMELAEHSDPEEWQRIMDRFFAILCEGVHRFEGTVDKFTGDGIMALFGAPITHEDHAQRACYAALHLQGELAVYSAELRRARGLNFSVRMGLNSGEVVVGTVGHDLGMAYTAIGHTVGLAQRMEQLAEPGKAYVSEHTAALVEGYVALTDLGEFSVKGVSHGLNVHELAGIGAARGRLDVARVHGLSRFVGRVEEMRVLESAVEQAFGGQGQVIGIVAEAGVGKSRLCHEFAERMRAKGTAVYRVAGQAHGKAVPLMPLLEFLRAYFEIGERDSERTARERIAGKLVLLDESFTEDLPLLFDFLGVPDPLRPAPRMDPEARQRQLLVLMKRLTHARSAVEPGVLIFEDLHWLDPASEAFLANHVDAVQAARTMTVLNFRPEYQAAWMSRSNYRQIALAPLADEDIEAMLVDLLGSDPSLDGLTALIRKRTEGNPFFIEELVQSLIEAGSLEGRRGGYRLVQAVDEDAVPASVQAVLAARIDRLDPRDKGVLLAASVIGKEFSEPVLAQVAGLDAAALEDALRALVAGEFVYERELYPEAIYAFKHPLTQEVAYRSQLSDRRAPLHAAVARAIAADNPERVDERSALLAQHFEAAGELLEAARWHVRAANWSGYNDPTQALTHWRMVRRLSDDLPESAETAALGLEARIFLLSYGVRLGIAHDDAAATFAEAERMASRTGDLRSRAILFNVYGNLAGLCEGDAREAARICRQASALAEEARDSDLYVGIASSAYSIYCIGAYEEALAASERALEMADGDPTLGAGIAVACPLAYWWAFKGLVLSQMGELEAASRMLERGREIARENGDSEVMGWSYMWASGLEYLRGDPSVLHSAQQSLEIAERLGDSLSRAYAWFFVGFAHAAAGNYDIAVDALERSHAIASERHAAVDSEAFRLAVLAECRLGLGDPAQARALAEEATAVGRAGGNAYYETYACLALARVLLASADPAARDQIEATLARALEISRESGSRTTEPLIRVELAALALQNADDEAHERELREAHRMFTEVGATGHAERLSAVLALLPT